MVELYTTRSSGNQARDALLAHIVGNGLKQGDMLLPEPRLAEALGIGRSSLREAIKSLEAFGLLEARHGVGVFVQSVSIEPVLRVLQFTLLDDSGELVELLELRRLIELSLAPQMIETLTPGDVADLELTVAQMQARAVRGEAFPEEDRVFHRQLLANSASRLTIKLLDTFWLIFTRAVTTVEGLVDPEPKVTASLHRDIVSAVQAEDLEALRAAIVRHYDSVIARINTARQRLEAGDAP